MIPALTVFVPYPYPIWETAPTITQDPTVVPLTASFYQHGCVGHGTHHS